ncbi:vWA domain-containing protein [Cohnella algarum]|uniref:vWA domain-containing protein n=1 Tax=Cohnella algarum TaxID=2044859 RepID=UPI0019671E4C|nr:VWA domain-containing protein [Cohnella algarum]MBN2983825.1 VWA domain-containing protein [Cohnella algarum]
MGFQSLAGIGFAASLPLIVLLYLLKRTYVDTPVPSSLLWRRALREQEANRPWQKLRRRLLLLLQLLAAALLTLALMGPYASGTSGSARPVAVVLDTSASMTAVSPEGDGAQSALQLAKLRVAEWLAEQPGARPVTLIAAGDQPVVLASAQRDREALEAALEAARPNYGRADLAAALSLADATLRGEAEGEIWLLTDGKARQQVEASAAVEVMASPLRVTEIDSGRANVSIAAFGVRGEAGTDTAAAVVTLMNRGLEPLSGTLAVRAEGVPEPAEESATFALEAGEQRSFRFDRLPAAEFYMATIGRIDGYAADNTAYAFSAAQAAGRALLVGEGNLFLEKALQLAGIQVVRADPAGFEPDGTIADTVDWVVLDGADEETLASDEWRKLIGSKPVWRIWSAETPPAGGEAVAPANGEAEVGDHPVVRYLTFGDVHISRLARIRRSRRDIRGRSRRLRGNDGREAGARFCVRLAGFGFAAADGVSDSDRAGVGMDGRGIFGESRAGRRRKPARRAIRFRSGGCPLEGDSGGGGGSDNGAGDDGHCKDARRGLVGLANGAARSRPVPALHPGRLRAGAGRSAACRRRGSCREHGGSWFGNGNGRTAGNGKRGACRSRRSCDYGGPNVVRSLDCGRSAALACAGMGGIPTWDCRLIRLGRCC